MDKQIELFRSEKKKSEYLKIYDLALSQLTTPFTSKYIGTSYGNTHVIRCGLENSPKLLMLHSMGFTSIAWHKNLEGLSKQFDIYCIDLIGEPNRTESNRIKITLTDYLQWLVEVLDALNLKKTNLVGWSYGGFLVTTFAMNFPNRIERVVTMSPAGTISPLTTSFYIKLLPALFSGKDKKINKFLKWISGKDNNNYPNPAFLLFTEGMKNFKGWARGTKIIVYSDDDFMKLKVPYLLLIGDKDPIYKKEIHNQLIDKFNNISPNIKANIIGGTHGFPMQESEVVNKKIISFLTN
ncbi:alpha/beta hydrolase [Cytobacillus sp. IB215665]|uniref:alpha/beta fold hydrolase n=1 Tax=Cytobacillus sp. IB215665 TaxID=3097357 RepID=UPI002A102C3E|nr:alpha/beta hydrolase [Cytobacillus sp. IB215665]MDX8367749.1 alpha/beta hydrolase [Cytobacillus sp. IB215665]